MPAVQWVHASQARQAAANAPPVAQMPRHYAQPFRNRPDNMALTVQHPVHHYPLQHAGTWSPGTPPGPVRVMFNDGNRAVVDTAVHDPNRGLTRNGRTNLFSLGHYHAAHQCDHSCPEHVCDASCPSYSAVP